MVILCLIEFIILKLQIKLLLKLNKALIKNIQFFKLFLFKDICLKVLNKYIYLTMNITFKACTYVLSMFQAFIFNRGEFT